MKMKKLTSLCGCLLLSMCMGVGAMTAPLSAEAAAREKVILDADMVDLFDDGIAMMMLAESPKMDLKGVTIVIGNTWLKPVQLLLSVSWRASAAPISLYIWALMKPFARTVSLT